MRCGGRSCGALFDRSRDNRHHGSTAATLAMRLYQDRLGQLGWDCLIPSEHEMQTPGQPGNRGGESRTRVAEAYAPARRAVGVQIARPPAAHARSAIGCTENPARHPGRPMAGLSACHLIDTIDALARASPIAWARGAPG